MDPKELLRRYLEQRREMGERDLVLDDLSVDEVMRILGAARAGGARPVERERERERARQRPADETAAPPHAREAPDDFAGDWRAALRSVGAPEGGKGKAPRRPTDDAEAGARTPPRESAREPTDPASPAAESDMAAPQPPAPLDPPAVPASVPAPGAGIVVGSTGGELFGGPFSNLGSVEELADVVKGCTRCPLYETATNAVPGEGNANAELVCVGEAPGATEDQTGRPFVGAAGQLLTKILAAINLQREDVFICNVLKHRPPGNRNPFPTEVEACSPYLVRQLELIRPKAILALGTFAAQTLLNTKLPIGKLRGAVHRYHGVPLVVTYHPAALLRNPAWKRPTWEDVQLVRRILDRAPGAP